MKLEKNKEATTIIERARRYADKVHAISTKGGHNATFNLAIKLIHGFCLSRSEALEILRQWNKTNTGGELWTEKELAHKVDSALKESPRRERGWLLGSPFSSRPSASATPSTTYEPVIPKKWRFGKKVERIEVHSPEPLHPLKILRKREHKSPRDMEIIAAAIRIFSAEKSPL